MYSIDPKEINVQRLHQLLLGAIGPRPIAFASTIDAQGCANLAPFSFFNVFSANPPILIFSPARSGRTNENKDTLLNAKVVKEVVINVVNEKMVHQMSIASAPYSPNIDEFIKSGFTPIASTHVAPFRVAESPVQFECKINQIIELGQQGGAGNLIICEVVQMHIQKELLTENGLIDQQKINLVARMGGDWYCHANSASMFEIKKPITTCPIGFDALPSDIKKSSVLSANNLGQLASIEALPNETDVNEYKLLELSNLFLSHEDDPAALELALHHRAKELLEQQLLNDAWLTLLSFNN